MPNVIRTMTRSTMIMQYLQHCEEESFEPASRLTLCRILEVREALQQKSLYCPFYKTKVKTIFLLVTESIKLLLCKS